MTIGNFSKKDTKEEYRKQLERFKSVVSKEEKVTIIGHDQIDVDSVASGILLSRLLTFLKIDNEFAILQPVSKNDETFQIIYNLTGINMSDYECNLENESRKLILVDHYETTHAGSVIACIDHHPTEKKNTYEFSYVKNSSSVSFMIYELMQAAGFPLTAEDAKLIVISMMVDTVAFRSSKTVPEEALIAKELARDFALDYDYLEKYSLCLTPIDEMSVQDIVSNGQKWYNFNSHGVGSSYVQLYGLPSEKEVLNWLECLSLKRGVTCSKLIVFIIFDTKDSKTYEYQVMRRGRCDYIKKIIHNGILSRGKDIMPKIERRLCSELSMQSEIEAIIKKLSSKSETIATMESCTGGSLAGCITNVSGASDILHESYVTYCNDAKIKLGVPAETIEEYTVYSLETAQAMAAAVKKYANSNIGIGITGQLGRIDPQNSGVEPNKAWYAIEGDSKAFSCEIILKNADVERAEKKMIIINEIIEDLYNRW